MPHLSTSIEGCALCSVGAAKDDAFLHRLRTAIEADVTTASRPVFLSLVQEYINEGDMERAMEMLDYGVDQELMTAERRQRWVAEMKRVVQLQATVKRAFNRLHAQH